MRLVPRVTSVTLVVGLVVASILAVGVVHAPAYAATDRAEAGSAHRLTAAQRYQRRHPRLARAVRIAVRQRGDRYHYGAEGPRHFDCSGLVYYAYRHAGFRAIPRTSRAQFRWARPIRHRQLRPGDLLFFHHRHRVYHVAIYLYRAHGHVVMLHAPRPGKRVQRDPPWTRHYWAATLRR